MEQIYAGYNTGMNTVTNTLNEMLTNPYVTAMVSLFIILYAGLAAPKLPKMVAKLFDHVVIKVLVLALILYINNFNPTIAIMVAIAFFITLQTLSRYNVMDMASEIFNIRKMLKQNGTEEEEEGEEEEAAYGANGQMVDGTGEMTHGNYGMNMETQVSGLAARTGHYQGPQGMKHPVGFGGDVEGADLMM